MMLERFQDPIEEHNEARLFDILSQSLKIFRQIIKGSASLSSQVVNVLPSGHLKIVEQSLKNLKILIKHRLQGIKWVSSQNVQRQILSRTFFRFASRLADIVSFCQHKLAQTSESLTLYREYLKRTESCIISFKKVKDIKKFQKDFFRLSCNFLNACRKMLSEGDTLPLSELQLRLSEDQQPDLTQKTSQTQSTFIEKDDQPAYEASLFHQNRKGKEKQGELRLLKGVDIDQDYLRSMMYLGKYQKEELFRTMSQKNQNTKKAIASYSLQFQSYIKRRAKLEIRSSRLNSKAQNHTSISCSAHFKIQNGDNRSKKALYINTQLSIDQFQSRRENEIIQDFKSLNRNTKTDKSIKSQDRSFKIASSPYQQIKSFNFSLIDKSIKAEDRSQKSRSQNRFRTISTSKVRVNCSPEGKTPKYIQVHPQIFHPILQIKQLSNSIEKQGDDPSHLQSIDREIEVASHQQGKDRLLNNKSIRERRNKNFVKNKYIIQISNSQIHQKLKRNGQNSILNKKYLLQQSQ